MKNLSHKLSVISILAFGFFAILPSDKRGVLVILLGLATLLSLILEKKFKWNKLLLINSALYLTYVLSLFYSIDSTQTFKRFETALSLILIPLFFTILSSSKSQIFSKSTQHLFYKFFIGSTLFFSLIIFIYIGTLGYYEGIINYEYCMSQLNRKLPLLNDHPIYISISLSLSILFSIDLIRKSKNRKRSIVFYIIGISILLFTLFFLSRKGIIVSLIISLIVLLISYFKSNKRILRISLLSLIILVILAAFIPSNQKRFKELFKTETYTTRNETNSTNNRIQIYKCALALIKNKPLIGYGVGKDRIALNQCYKENLYYLYENKFNTHSQYLSIATKIGLLGLLIFLFFLFYNFRLALKTKNGMFLSIILFYGLVFLFENVLERQNGVILFAFLLNYFAYRNTLSHKANAALNF